MWRLVELVADWRFKVGFAVGFNSCLGLLMLAMILVALGFR